jgi:hypothetical protein
MPTSYKRLVEIIWDIGQQIKYVDLSLTMELPLTVNSNFQLLTKDKPTGTFMLVLELVAAINLEQETTAVVVLIGMMKV